MPNLLWKDIKKTTNEIFNIWVGNPELLWAHDAWQKISEQGLASYENELEKQIVLMRLFALGTLYHEFCKIAFEENGYVNYIWWIEALPNDGIFLSPFRLGQLVGSNYRSNEVILDEDNEQEFIAETVNSLVEQQRKIIVSALLKGYGSSSLLFAKLWISNRIPSDIDENSNDMFDAETLDDVLNTNINGYKMQAFNWIEDGMPSMQDYVFYPHIQSKCESVKNVIAKGESYDVEFKVGLCLSPHAHKRDESMIENVLKTIAAFINSDGGVLLIGVHDNGDIEGINSEYPIVNSKKITKTALSYS